MNAARTIRSLALVLVLSAVSATAQAGSLDVTWTADEVRLLDLMNQERARLNLPPLVPQAQLTLAARKHSRDMLATGIYDHRINDKQPSDRVAAEGITWYGSLAENITHVRTPEEAVQSWINSPGHLQNMTSTRLTRVGIGVGATEADGSRYWTVVFSADELEGTLGQVTMPSANGQPETNTPGNTTVDGPQYNLMFGVANQSSTTLEVIQIGFDGQERIVSVVGQNQGFGSMTATGITWILRVADSGREICRLTMGSDSRTVRIPYQG